jgi:hypothetical protein
LTKWAHFFTVDKGVFIVHIHGEKVGKNLEDESEGEFKLYLVIRES